MFDFKDISIGYLKFIVYSSYATVLCSSVWLSMNIIREGWGGIGTFVPLTAGIVFFFYGRYFEGKMNNHKG